MSFKKILFKALNLKQTENSFHSLIKIIELLSYYQNISPSGNSQTSWYVIDKNKEGGPLPGIDLEAIKGLQSAS